MEHLYETKISDAKWIAYDVPGNVGWIVYFVCLIRYLKNGIDGLFFALLIPAVFMLVGIVELISERIAKLNRVLPKARLYRGFGALTLGGILGAAASIAGLVIRGDQTLFILMLTGAALCAVFSALLFAGYKKMEENAE